MIDQAGRIRTLTHTRVFAGTMSRVSVPVGVCQRAVNKGNRKVVAGAFSEPGATCQATAGWCTSTRCGFVIKVVAYRTFCNHSPVPAARLLAIGVRQPRASSSPPRPTTRSLSRMATFGPCWRYGTLGRRPRPVPHAGTSSRLMVPRSRTWSPPPPPGPRETLGRAFTGHHGY